MANLLIMDDEALSLHRLCLALSNDRQHRLYTARDLTSAGGVLQSLGSSLDLLVIDVSMFQSSPVDLMDLLAGNCPRARVLVLSPFVRNLFGRKYPLLRKPFTDGEFVEAVQMVLTMQQGAVVHCDFRRGCHHHSSCSNRVRLERRRAIAR